MKITLAILALSFVSLTCNASYVEGAVPASESTCFVPATAVPSSLPKAICLRSLDVGQTAGSVVLNTDLEDTAVKPVRTVSYARHNEDRLNFVAEFALAMELTGWNPACSEAEYADVVLSGEINQAVSPQNLSAVTVEVRYSHLNDVCHSPSDTQVFLYTLKK